MRRNSPPATIIRRRFRETVGATRGSDLAPGARWSKDVSEDIVREIMRRFGLAGDELPSSLEAFGDQHLGPDRQLTFRR
jgi:hypothetical protein